MQHREGCDKEKRKVRALISETVNNDIKIKQLESQIKSCNSQHEMQVDEYKKIISSMTEQLDKLKTEKEENRKEVDNKLNMLESEVNILRKARKRLEQERKKLEDQMTIVKENLIFCYDRDEERKSEIAEMDSKLALCHDSKEQLRETIKQDEEKLQAAKKEVDRLIEVGKNITNKGVELLKKEGAEKEKYKAELEKTQKRLRAANNDLLILGHPTHMKESLKF